jgi:ABC-type antimicrobial peptide transport system permease subunit
MLKAFKLKPSLEDLVKSAVRSILKNKVRTFLTSLGIIIGVTSVILLVSIGNGLKDFVVEQFDSLGSNVIYVMPGSMFSGDGGSFNGPPTGGITFKEKDISNLRRKLKPKAIFPLIESQTEIKYINESKKTSIEVTNYEYGKSMNSLPSEGNGRWFTKAEENKKSKVIVLGYNVKDELFGSANPLNKKVNVGGSTLKVIGYLDKKGRGLGGASVDDVVSVELWVKESGRSLKYFKYDYLILDVYEDFTVAGWGDENFGDFEKVLVASLILLILVGVAAGAASLLGGPVVTLSALVLGFGSELFGAGVGFFPASIGHLIALGCLLIILFGRGEI